MFRCLLAEQESRRVSEVFGLEARLRQLQVRLGDQTAVLEWDLAVPGTDTLDHTAARHRVQLGRSRRGEVSLSSPAPSRHRLATSTPNTSPGPVCGGLSRLGSCQGCLTSSSH